MRNAGRESLSLDPVLKPNARGDDEAARRGDAWVENNIHPTTVFVFKWLLSCVCRCVLLEARHYKMFRSTMKLDTNTG